MKSKQRPTAIGAKNSNRRLYESGQAYTRYLSSIQYAGYTTLKPPGVKKTMAMLAQETVGDESVQAVPPVQVLPDASGFSSWQTDSFPNSSFMPRTAPAAPAAISRSPMLNFREFDDTRSIYIHQDSSLI